MLRTVGVKLARLVPVLFLVSLATFFMLELVPGDPAVAVLGPEATPQQYAAVRRQLGLDRPVVSRYLHWLGSALHGDLGQSLKPPIENVSSLVSARLPVTLELALVAMAMTVLGSVPLALLAAYKANGRFDRVSNAVAYAFISVPSFLTALLLVFFMIFHVGLMRWLVGLVGAAIALVLARSSAADGRGLAPGPERTRFLVRRLALVALTVAVTVLLAARFPAFPRQGFVRLTDRGLGPNLRSVFLPALTLTIVEMAVLMRLLRSDLISTLQEEFILTAKAKGMPASRILLRDALKPSSFSAVTLAGVSLGRLLGGTAIVETIFNLPGMGTLLISSIQSKDYRVVQGAVLVIALLYVVLNVVVDLSYAYLDPRVRRGRR